MNIPFLDLKTQFREIEHEVLPGRKAEGSYQNQNEQCLLIEEVPGQDEQDKQELIFGYPEEKQKEVIIEIW